RVNIDRRIFLSGILSLSADRMLAQRGGMASRTVRPQPRGKPSGLPYSHFTDIAAAAGLTAPVFYGGVDHKEYILGAIGCGCAFIDYDNDGWMDIFILGGTRLTGPPPGATNRLYRNNRDGTFTDVTEQAGLHQVGWAAGVCVGDYDNDGFDDIFCTSFGQNKLYHNNGDGTFTDVTKKAGLENSVPRWGTGCSFLDYDRDGRLDLFVSNYVQFDFARVPKAGQDPTCNFKGVPVNCGPRGLTPGYHSLYHNNGDGTFTDVSKHAGISSVKDCYGLTAVTADLDEDGWPDILVACDSTPTLLFMNNHDGTFREEGINRGIAFSGDGDEQAGMGLGVGDYDLDGHTDIFKTHFMNDANGLFHNNGKGVFEDVTVPSRLAVETRYVCWGAGIVDLDNDGHPDLFMVTGNVYPELEKKFPQYPNKGPRVVFRNLANGTFEELIGEAGPGVEAAHSSRGCAFGDFDNDGDLDILIVNLNEPPSLLRNDVPAGRHWLKIKLIGTRSNRSAIGARVLVRYGGKLQAQDLLSQSSFLSANDPRLHFGLGKETTADVEIHWPSGVRTSLRAIPADQLVTIKEGTGIIPSLGWPAKKS
ncbi:MAG: CRTAC1 family protein, partial [Acidobacteriaceae bacterium]